MADAERKSELPPNTSNISRFMRDESLAGFITRNSELDRDQFLAKHQQPVLLTSMPSDTELTPWAILMPLKKKLRAGPPRGPLDKTISTRVSLLQKEAASRPNSY